MVSRAATGLPFTLILPWLGLVSLAPDRSATRPGGTSTRPPRLLRPSSTSACASSTTPPFAVARPPTVSSRSSNGGSQACTFALDNCLLRLLLSQRAGVERGRQVLAVDLRLLQSGLLEAQEVLPGWQGCVCQTRDRGRRIADQLDRRSQTGQALIHRERRRQAAGQYRYSSVLDGRL